MKSVFQLILQIAQFGQSPGQLSRYGLYLRCGMSDFYIVNEFEPSLKSIE